MKLGIVGTGRVAHTHAAALQEISPALIAGAWNRTFETAETFCKKFGGRSFHSFEEMLAAGDVTAVSILSSTPTHFDFAKTALKAGKHVLLEKPVCESSEQIKELLEIEKQSGKICMPSHNYLYSEDLRRLKRHFDVGHLGRALNFWVMFNNFHPSHYGMTDTYMMRELFIHHIYVLLHFLGRPKSVSATGANSHFDDPSAIDQMVITAVYENGTIANLWGSFAAEDISREPWSYYVKIMGTKGSGLACWDKIKYGEQPEPLWDDGGYWDSFMLTNQYFVTQCLEKEKAPLSTLQDAYDAAMIFEHAVKSMQSMRQIELAW